MNKAWQIQVEKIFSDGFGRNLISKKLFCLFKFCLLLCCKEDKCQLQTSIRWSVFSFSFQIHLLTGFLIIQKPLFLIKCSRRNIYWLLKKVSNISLHVVNKTTNKSHRSIDPNTMVRWGDSELRGPI